MSQEIAVIGSPEFTAGFRLAGVRRFANVSPEADGTALDEAVEEMVADENVGIVVMHDDDLDALSRSARKTVETSVEPTFVTLGGGAGSGGLREKIKRAIGIDLMEDEGDNQ